MILLPIDATDDAILSVVRKLVSADGCTLVTHRIISYQDPSGGFFGDDLEQTLDFSVVPVTGPASHECVGECACDGATGTATAVEVGG